MTQRDYTTTLETTRTANEASTAICNVPGWWTENFEGASKKVGDEFTVTFGETWIKLRVEELVQNYKIVWLVTDCFKHFLKNKKEWVGTRIIFDISNEKNEKTKIVFTHEGLTSPLECYEICCDAWGGYLGGSLQKLIDTGKGTPDSRM